MYPNNPNNPGFGFQRPNTPDINDPNLLNNPQFFQMINQMQVSPTRPGFANWNMPQEMYGYAAFQNTPTQMFGASQRVITPPTTPLDSPDVEIVQETQVDMGAGGSQPRPGRRPRQHKKKPIDEPRMKVTKHAWTPEEEMLLCRAWLEVTEDPKEANFQKEKTYWKRITEQLLKLEGKPEDYRDHDGVGSKWRKMRPIIQSFNQIYTRLSNANNHQSGSNDADVQRRALEEFQGLHGKAFGYLAIWEKLRHSSKFHLVVDFNAKKKLGEPSAKRSKTSSSADAQSVQGSDAHVNIDLNSTEDEFDFSRPVGRDKAKKSTLGGSSSLPDYTDSFERLGTRLEGLMDISKARADMGKKKLELGEKKLKIKEAKNKREDFLILTTDYSHLQGTEREMMENLKQEIKEKYGYS